MPILPYKNPLTPLQVLGNSSLPRSMTFGTDFSVLGTGGFMEVYSLNDLVYKIPTGFTGNVEFSGNTIPIQFRKGSGTIFSPDVLTLNSDNISSGRRRLGMLVFVYETDTIYQFYIHDYDNLWSAATNSSGPGGASVVISEFGTTIKNNTVEGQNFINSWTASTIEGVGGVSANTASWRILQVGGGPSSGGTSGISGLVGNSGISGLSGESGESGISGLVGNSGLSGESGESGISGLVGNSGLSGESGISGLIGNSGISGIPGSFAGSGISGLSGQSGLSGNSGISGVGLSGISGLAGTGNGGGTSISAFTYNPNTFIITDYTGGTFQATIDVMTGLTINGNLTVTGDSHLGSVSATTYYNLPFNYFITNTIPTGVTINYGDRWYNTNSGIEFVYITDGDSTQWVQPASIMGPPGYSNLMVVSGITTSAATLDINTNYYGVNYNGIVNLTIPDPTGFDGHNMTIKDEGGYCGIYKIRLTPALGNIDGNSYVDMNINYMALHLVARNNNWWII